MIKLSFHGACREVTGSCSLLEYANTKILVDCGAFQGEHFASEHNQEPFAFDPAEVKYLFLTHAHMDHCGRLPKLYKDGFRGKIYTTAATHELAEIMLLDAANIIAREALATKRAPLFSEEDVVNVMRLFSDLPYDEKTMLDGLFKVNFRDAGHILGSASMEFYFKDEGQEKKIVFSGDLGNSPSLIIRPTEFIEGADAVIVESTYAGVTHESKDEGLQKIKEAITGVIASKGVLMIPIFVIEKTQEILFELDYLSEHHEVPRVPMFLDSPLAIKAVAIYDKYKDLYNEESRALIKGGDDIFNFPGLTYTKTVEESKRINVTPAPKVILASSGMCVGGRIPHHLKLNLPDPNSQLVLVSYQAPGSLGRKLLRGDKEVLIDNEMVQVRAKVSLVNSYSSHADEPHLLEWVGKIQAPKPGKVFVNHGEEASSLLLATKIEANFGIKPTVPEYGQSYEI